MFDRSIFARSVAQALTFGLVTALATVAPAQDRPKQKTRGATQQPAAKPTPRKTTKQRRDAADDAHFEGEAKTRPSKPKRDAADDALFDGPNANNDGAPRRPPVSTAGPWPADDTSPWPAEDDSPWPAERGTDAESDELFDDLDEDMKSPADRREAEERGSTRVPSPDSSNWGVTPLNAGPETLEWQEGADLPDGYEKSSRVRKGLVIGGAVTFGVSWLASAGYGSYLISQRESDYWERDDEEARPEMVLFVPLAGPWIALGTVEHDRREAAVFVAGGIVQAGGLAMLIAGVVAKQPVLVKNKHAEVGIVPSVGPNGSGAMLHGSF